MDWKKWLDQLKELPWAKQWRLLAGFALLLGGFLSFAFWAYTPDYAPLFHSLSEKDSGSVMSYLDQNQVSYKLASNGVILVDRTQVYDLRYKLAAQDLPKHTNEDTIEAPPFGATSQQEQSYQQKIKEMELSKSIRAISGISSARVHLALPKQTIFGKETTNPSASVVLDSSQGNLSRAQSAAIAKLIAGAVPGLDPDKVSIIDSKGHLIEAASSDNSSTPEQKQMIQETRQDYQLRIERLLESIAGKGSVRAEVDVDMEFGHEEAVVETFKPNAGEATVRSAKFLEKKNNSNANGGLPGSPTNFPPSALPPLPPVPGASSPTGKTNELLTSTMNGQVESVVNYEVDRSVVKSSKKSNQIKRINAAVLMNTKKITGKDGKPLSVPFTNQEIAQFQSLVKETIGYNEARGDSVQVVSMSFVDEPAQDDSLPIWKDPYYQNLLQQLIKWGIAGIFGLLLLKQTKKLMLSIMPPPPPPAEPTSTEIASEATTTEAMDGSIHTEKTDHEKAVENVLLDMNQVKTIAQTNPQAVALIIKDWVEGEEK